MIPCGDNKKEKLPASTRARHEHLIGQMLAHLASNEEADGMAAAEKAFWEARECLVGGEHHDVLGQFDAIYLKAGREVSDVLAQLREVLRLKGRMDKGCFKGEPSA